MTDRILGDLNPGDRFHFGDRTMLYYVSVRASDQKLMEQEMAPCGDIVAYRDVWMEEIHAACSSERVVYVGPRK
jgi:hypothetical protein